MDPLTGEIAWQYIAKPPDTFYSWARGSNERLANGNTLIAESDPGRLLEVTHAGDIVWEFYNPDLTPRGTHQPLYRALRYEADVVERLLAEHGG